MSDQLMGELNLIKRWEIHFQRKEATCVDKMALGGEDAAAVVVAATRKLCRKPWCAHEPASPSTAANKQETAANFSRLLEKQKLCSGVIAAGGSSLLDAAGMRRAASRPSASPLLPSQFGVR